MGFSGDDAPRAAVPTVSARAHSHSGLDKDKIFVGDELQTKKQQMKAAFYPMERGQIRQDVKL